MQCYSYSHFNIVFFFSLFLSRSLCSVDVVACLLARFLLVTIQGERTNERERTCAREGNES